MTEGEKHKGDQNIRIHEFMTTNIVSKLNGNLSKSCEYTVSCYELKYWTDG